MDFSKFELNSFYHIFNRSIGNELLFINDLDYKYFINKMNRFILPYADIFSYSLIPDHFHLLLKVKEKNDLSDDHKSSNLDQALKNFFNSYTRSYNIAHNRHGKLFQHGYKSKIIDSDDYLKWIIYYIHRNPVHHNLVNSCENWKYSSYNNILNESNKWISEFIFNIYGDKLEFEDFTSELTKKYVYEID